MSAPHTIPVSESTGDRSLQRSVAGASVRPKVGLPFKAVMVRALLDGSKTQSRRVVKSPPSWATSAGVSAFTPEGKWSFRGRHPEHGPAEKFIRCPYGARGERVFVREALRMNDRGNWYYEASGPDCEIALSPNDDRDRLMQSWANDRESTYCNARYMPRWASRILLEVTDVRVQRLHEITDQDARAEGVRGREMSQHLPVQVEIDGHPREAFALFWNSINEARAPWLSNPWVWALTFKRVTP